MTLPLATTTISILRPTVSDGDIDGYPDVEAVYSAVATGIRAKIVGGAQKRPAAGGRTKREGSEQAFGELRLIADPCGLLHTDHVLDESTQITYRVDWLSARHGFGLDHIAAELTIFQGYMP